LTADFERQNFSVSQCTSPNPPLQPHILPIKTLAESVPPPGPHHLSGGAIAGIVIGILAFFLLSAIITLLLLKRHRRQRQKKQPPSHLSLSTAELDSPNQDPHLWTPTSKSGYPSAVSGYFKPAAELDTVEHKGHEIDGHISPQPVYELDAPQTVPGAESPRTHRRGRSDPSDLGSVSEEGFVDERADAGRYPQPSATGGSVSPQSADPPDASKLHKRGLSDPTSLGSISEEGTVVGSPLVGPEDGSGAGVGVSPTSPAGGGV